VFLCLSEVASVRYVGGFGHHRQETGERQGVLARSRLTVKINMRTALRSGSACDLLPFVAAKPGSRLPFHVFVAWQVSPAARSTRRTVSVDTNTSG
jgi:hypothetical protein